MNGPLWPKGASDPFGRWGPTQSKANASNGTGDSSPGVSTSKKRRIHFDPADSFGFSDHSLRMRPFPKASPGLMTRLRDPSSLSAELVHPGRSPVQVGQQLSTEASKPNGASLDRASFQDRLLRYRRIRSLADRVMASKSWPTLDSKGRRLMRLMSMQDALLTGIRRDLARAGLHPDLSKSVPLHQLPEVAALLEAWSEAEDVPKPLSSVHGADLHALKSLVERGPDAVDRVRAAAPALPASYRTRPGALAHFEHLTETSFRRGERLRQELDFEPTLLEAELLDRLEEVGFEAMVQYFHQLRESAGLELVSAPQARHGETHLQTVANYLEFDTRDPESGSADEARTRFVQGATRLAQATDSPFRLDHWPLAVALGGTDTHVADTLVRLLERVEIGTHPEGPWVLLDLAQRLSQVEPEQQAQGMSLLDAVRHSLNTELLPPEAASLLRAWALGKELDRYEIRHLQQLKAPPGEALALKDIYTWSRLRRVEREMPKEVLAEAVEKRLTPGTVRSDEDAEYSDRLVDHVQHLSTPELHKLRKLQDALRRPDFRKELRGAVALALYQPSTEWGGRVVMKPGALGLQVLPPDSQADPEQYDYPLEEADPMEAMAHFHLHVPDEAGDPAVAGPSSGFGGAVADRGAAYRFGQDGVVFTLVNPEVVNVSFFSAGGAVVNLGDHRVPAFEPHESPASSLSPQLDRSARKA